MSKGSKAQKEKTNEGITLIALVITIIVLLILAGISIAMLTGENGLLTKTSEAKEKTDEANAREKLELSLYSAAVQKYTSTEYNEKEWLNKHVVEENPQEEIKIDEDIFVVNGWGFLVDRSVPKIVESLGKTTLKPKKPKIEILEGEKLENDWYTSNIKIKIQGTGYKINEETITLENGMKEIEIEEDGIYEFIAYIEGKTQEEYEEVKLTVKRDTTAPEDFTPVDGMGNGTGRQLQITAKSNDFSGINEYRYYLNNNYIATSNNENYTITGLEPFKEYELYVIAKDNAGREKKSSTIKFNTGIYLYNNGNEYTDITGGWKKISKAADPGEHVISTKYISMKNDTTNKCIEFIIYGDEYPDDNGGAGIGTANKIKLDKFKYMCSTMTVSLPNYEWASQCLLTMDFGRSAFGDPGCSTLGQCLVVCYKKEISTKTDFKWDITNLTGLANPSIYLQTQLGEAAVAKIYTVGLLK